MWGRAARKFEGIRELIRGVFAIDDSPHAVALGVAIGMFVGLTPTVGAQTIIVLTFRFLSRPFFYFNVPAGVASTYVSNPVTMIPMYYFWYHLGLWFFPGTAVPGGVNFEALLDFEGFSGWWQAMCRLCVQVGVPTFAGALITAPFGAAIGYVGTYFTIRRIRGSQAAQELLQEEAASKNAPQSPERRTANKRQLKNDPDDSVLVSS